MPPCGSDGSLPSRPQWTALFDLFDIVLSVFECMCIFSLFYYSLYSAKKKVSNRTVTQSAQALRRRELSRDQCSPGCHPNERLAE